MAAPNSSAARTSAAVRVVLIEPNDVDAASVASLLDDTDATTFVVTHSASAEDLQADGQIDVILLGLSTVGPRDIAVIQSIQASGLGAPLIVIASTSDAADALRALQSGAHDCLQRANLDRAILEHAIQFAFERHKVARDLERRVSELQASEARSRTIIEKTADAIIIVDAAGVIQFVNPAAEKLFRRSKSELAGETFGFPVVAGETADIDLVRGDGNAMVAELRAAETTWDNKPAYLASLRDITDRRKAEERARKLVSERSAREAAEAAERRSNFLADASSLLGRSLDYHVTLFKLAQLMCPFMASWCVIDVVERKRIRRIAACHFDPSRESFLDELKRKYAPAKALSRDPVARVISTGAAEIFTRVTDEWVAEIAHDDTHLEVLRALEPESVLVVPINARGHTIGAMTLVLAGAGRLYTPQDLDVAQEIARRAGFAIDNARLYQRAREANQVKSDFLAVMGHELRTPLNAIIGYGDLMELGVPEKLPDVFSGHVARIKHSAKHLLTLIDEIFTFTRVEAGQERVRREPVSVRDIVAHAAAAVETLAHDKGIVITTPGREDDPFVIHSDPAKVRQILLNLLSNAVKFTDKGSVVVNLERDHKSVFIRLHDTGIGISAEHMERIFDSFWQVERSATRRAGGTGLGLTITRHLARLLGGDVQVESSIKDGSTFTVRLPLDTAASTPGRLQ